MSSILEQPVLSSSNLVNTYAVDTITEGRGPAEGSAASEPYGISWTVFRAGSVIVDVGGGLGTYSLNLANTYPHLRFVVQGSWPEGESVQLANAYCFASSGRVKFQVHDMFSPQPVRTATLFVLKHIAPRLSESDLHQILSRLRLAAAPSTQLVLIDDECEGERTLRHVSQLLKRAGWGMTHLHTEQGRTPPSRTVFAAPL